MDLEWLGEHYLAILREMAAKEGMELEEFIRYCTQKEGIQ